MTSASLGTRSQLNKKKKIIIPNYLLEPMKKLENNFIYENTRNEIPARRGT